MPRLVTIATFQDTIKANIYKAKLQAAGIYSFLADENTVGINWLFSNAIGGIRLQVTEEDVENALYLLEDNPILTSSSSTEEENMISPSMAATLCPNCHSSNVKKDKFSKEVAGWRWTFLGFPLPFLSKAHHCFECGHLWKK